MRANASQHSLVLVNRFPQATGLSAAPQMRSARSTASRDASRQLLETDPNLRIEGTRKVGRCACGPSAHIYIYTYTYTHEYRPVHK